MGEIPPALFCGGNHMGFVVDYVRKIKEGISIGHKLPRFGNAREEFQYLFTTNMVRIYSNRNRIYKKRKRKKSKTL